MSTNNIHQAATAYAMRGFSVIPLKPKDKRPDLKSWDPYKTQHASWDEIDRWFRVPKNIGIVTGAISGIIVLDIDGPDGDEALKAITGRHGDLPATWCSITGKGRHYLFRHPGGELKNMANRQLSIDVRGDGGYIVAPPSTHPSGAEYAWTQDDQQDIADAPAWLIEWITADRTPAWVDEILIILGRIEIPAVKTEKQKKRNAEVIFSGNKEKNNSAKADFVLNSCAFCQHCEQNATTISEPMWHAMITNIGRADGGRELVHRLSAPHPDYSEKDTDAKLDRALASGEPHTCDYIQRRIGFGGCPPDGCGVKAPIVFATSELIQAQSVIGDLVARLKLDSDPQPATVLSKDVIDALATLRRRDMAEYTLAKAEIKSACKTLNLRDLETIVKIKVDEQKEIRMAERIEEANQANQALDVKVDFGFQITIPTGWGLTNAGVHLVSEDGLQRVMPVLLYLTKRIHNADTGEEKVQLSYYRDEEWRQISVARPVAFNRSQITSLSTHALPVTSENAKDVINYLSDFEASNMETIPVIKSVGRMGWIGSKQFLPYAAPTVELDVDPGMTAIASGYTTSGTLADWIICTKEARKSPLVRMLMAASFAAPMLRLVGHRVFLVHIWGPSRGGKTAALKAALSVWGEPETIMASFNSTRVGLERLAGFYSDLPLGVDERQLVGNKQDLIESLVYLIGMGKGKTRGTKGGGIQAAHSWRTIALTTGEEPLSSESSNTGIKTRVVELYGEPFSDERVAANVHQVTKDHYGHAGELMIQKLIEQSQESPETFKQAHQMLADQIVQKYPKHMGAKISQLAMLAIGDIWSSTIIYGTDFNTAVIDALALIDTFAGQIQTSESADESVVAAQKLWSWIRAHHSNFGDKAFEQFGYKVEGAFFILGHKFDEAIKELGFNGQRMLRDWAKRGWIKTEKAGDRVRFRVRHWDAELKHRVECIAFLGPTDGDME
jgi:uncharacterized protein (DUF927 family)